MDQNQRLPPALDELKADQTLSETTELQPVKYLNNKVEQDHRAIKRLVNPGMGFGSFNTARRTLRGYEAMNMISKGQIHGVEKGDIQAQAERLRVVGCALRRLFLCGNAIPAPRGDFLKSSRVPQSVSQIFGVAA